MLPEVGKDVTIPQLRQQGYAGFYVAIGLQNGGKLGIPGGDAEGVQAGIDFVKSINMGGDVYSGQKFVIDAIAAGKEGAISLHRYVQPHSSLTIGRNRRQFIALDKDNLALETFDNTPRQRPGYNEALRKTFRDDRTGFTAEQVKAETSRCLGCGASVVDPNKCIGCGVCTTKCAFDAILLYRERPECSEMLRLGPSGEEALHYGGFR